MKKLKGGRIPKAELEKSKKRDADRISNYLNDPVNAEHAAKYQYNQDVNILNEYDDEFQRKKLLAEKRQKAMATNPKLLEAFQRVSNKNMMDKHNTKMEEIRQQREYEAEQERQRIEYEKALQAQRDKENDPFTQIGNVVGDIVGVIPGFSGVSEGIKTGVQGVNMLRGQGLYHCKTCNVDVTGAGLKKHLKSKAHRQKNIYHCETCDKDVNVSYIKRHIKSKGHMKKGSGLMDLVHKGVDFVKDAFSKREGFNNVSQRTLKQFGDYSIKRIQIVRKPIMKALESFIKIISLGAYDPQKYGFDKMFHLGMIVTVNLPNGQDKMIMIEKVDAVTISSTISMTGDNVEYIEVPVAKQLTINEMCENALNKVGNKTFFDYDAFKNNCQSFLLMLLLNSQLLKQSTKEFIYQDVKELAEDMPEFSKKVMNGITDLGQITNKLLGSSLDLHAIKIKKHVHIKQAIEHVQNITKSKKRRALKDTLKNYNIFRIKPKTKFKNFINKKISDDIVLVIGQPK